MRAGLIAVIALGAGLGGAGWAARHPAPNGLPPNGRTPNGPLPAALWRADAALSARLRARVGDEAARLDGALDRLGRAATPRARRAAFRDARAAYKRLEGVLAYYAPPVAAALNGTEADEGDDNPDAGRVLTHGFPRLEPRVFARSAAGRDSLVVAEAARMRAFVATFRTGVPYLATADAQALELARLELGRVSTLGVAGVDAGAMEVARRDVMRDEAAALDGVRAAVAEVASAVGPAAGVDSAARAADARLVAASEYLRSHPDFAALDRFAFVTRYANPAFAALAALRRRVPGPDVSLRRAWAPAAASVYDARAFDPMAFADAGAPRSTPAWVALGRDLFRDPALSGDGSRACASCHVPARAFSDGRPRALALAVTPVVRHVVSGAARPLRHTPPLAYAAWQPAQFADARATTLEAQIDSVLASPAEMGGSTARAAARLAADPAYRRRFAAASGVPGSGVTAYGVTPFDVRRALAAYVRSLGRFDSRFDRAVRGEHVVLTAAERRGFNLFMGRARCGTCHFAPLFNGTAPPDFARSDVEVIGVPERFGAARGRGRVRVDPDSGRAALDRLDGHLHAFKTPTVRAAALGGPFMHNGALRTLDDVLDFYDRGGGAGLGAAVPGQTLPAGPLRLTPGDRRALAAFLRALAEPGER